MKKLVHGLMALSCTLASPLASIAQEHPIYKQVGFSTATGGYANSDLTGGTVVSVSTFSALKSNAESSSKLVIKVTGAINGGNAVINVKSNKTIIGEGTKADLKGVQLVLSGVSNIIIRNVKLHETPDNGDLIGLQNAKNVWVDHCEFYNVGISGNKDEYDGMLDARDASQNITVSWNYFHDHWKGLLFGSSDSDDDDRKATFHHNYFYNVNSRLPSYRGGTGHVFSNYYEKIPTSGINSRVNACLKIEENVFQDAIEAITTLDSDVKGKWDVKNNVFLGTTTGRITTSNCTFNPPYTYTSVLTPASDVVRMVKAYAGIGKLDAVIVTDLEEEGVEHSTPRLVPNPTESIVRMIGYSGRYTVYDVQGNVVQEGNGDTIDLGPQQPGMYFVNFGGEKVKVVRK